MKPIAIIPARGGSKRIKNKNIVKICDRPMIAWTIRNVVDSEVFEKVYVSTDSSEIASVAEVEGAVVPEIRPDQLSDDFTSVTDVIRYFVETFSIKSDWIALVYATAILLKPKYLAEAARKAEETPDTADFVMSVVRFSHPIQRAVELVGDQVKVVHPEFSSYRTQDLPPRYHDAGQFVFGRNQAWRSAKTVWNSHTIGVEIPADDALDIDTPSDLRLAEALVRSNKQSCGNS